MSRSIYSLLHDNLRKMLIVTLGVSAVLILIYATFSFKQSKDQAARFVMNHVEHLAQAGVLSQSVGDVDWEVAAFAKTWKETQLLELRIDIYLNDKLITHSGQLQPFGYFSTSTEKRLSLPSGDKLRVMMQMDLTGFILYRLLLLACLEGAIVALFYILKRSMQNSVRSITQPLESKVAWLKEIAHDLPKSARVHASFVPAGIDEIDDLGKSIETLTRQIVALEDHLAKINFDRGCVKMAKQVAHSIKGAIATLQLRAGDVSDAAERRGLLDCIKTLSEISGTLLKPKQQEVAETQAAAPRDPIHLLPAVRSAVFAKDEQYRNRAGILIRLDGDAFALGRFSQIKNAELQTILFNLIDNSVDALDPSGGTVSVIIRATETQFQLQVQDNGRGVPEHILPSLMIEGFSYNKDSGNGIGLSHIKEIVESVSGKIEINSQEGVGTTVLVQLPLVKATQTDIRAIAIQPGTTIVCVDDDPLVHTVWSKRFQRIKGDLREMVHLRSVTEFDHWLTENGSGRFGSRLYLFDFDLKDEARTGIDLIEESGLSLESILVSGMTECTEVRSRTEKMGLRCLSKDFIAVVPILVDGQVSPNSLQAVQALS